MKKLLCAASMRLRYALTAFIGAQKPASLVISLALLTVASSADAAPLTSQTSSMKIRIYLEDQTVTATLYDNPAASDFATLLPLTLTLQDYAGIERVADLPCKLSTQGAPDSMTPQAGDIAHYAPWGNLAIFVGNGSYAKHLVPLGHITEGLPVLARTAPYPVRIERIEN